MAAVSWRTTKGAASAPSTDCAAAPDRVTSSERTATSTLRAAPAACSYGGTSCRTAQAIRLTAAASATSAVLHAAAACPLHTVASTAVAPVRLAATAVNAALTRSKQYALVAQPGQSPAGSSAGAA